MPVYYAGETNQENKENEVAKLKLPNLTTFKKLGENEKQYFIIDFAKVKTIEELVLIIASMGIVISTENPLFTQLEHLVDKEHPIKESDLKR